MQILEPKNKNYSAIVVKIKDIIALSNCDNVVATNIFGYQAIVGRDVKVGDIGIFFPAETQLSDEYCRENNLYRHSEFNKDTKQKGYIENNRRVRAVKFRGNRSDCLFMPITSLSYACNISELKVDDIFDTLNNREICRKYEVHTHSTGIANLIKKPKFRRVDEKFMPQHIDSDHYLRVEKVFPDNVELIVTQKLHGTSIRVGYTKVNKKLNLIYRLLKKVGVPIQETQYEYVYGSRKVIKDELNKNHNHYYDTDIWTLKGKELDGRLPKNFIIYGELVGWTPNGRPIQENYTYGVNQNMSHLYVYRVMLINDDGYTYDLSYDQMTQFCADKGLLVVPLIWRGLKKDFNPGGFINKRFYDIGMRHCVQLSHKTLPDEGVCIRVESRIPYITKLKSPLFLEHETKMLDAKKDDLEATN